MIQLTKPRRLRVWAILAAFAVLGGLLGACGAEASTPSIVLSQDNPDLADLSGGIDAASLPTADSGTDLADLTFERIDVAAPDSATGAGTAFIGDYGGTPLVVNFFAAWCPPCVREMPDFQSVYERLRGKVNFLGLSQDANIHDAVELVRTTGVTYDIGWDADLEVYRETGSIGMPTTAFVTASGQLADVLAGALNEDSLVELIAESLHIAE